MTVRIQPTTLPVDAVSELISILPDVNTAHDIIKKPVALDDFIMAVKTALVQ